MAPIIDFNNITVRVLIAGFDNFVVVSSVVLVGFGYTFVGLAAVVDIEDFNIVLITIAVNTISLATMVDTVIAINLNISC